MLFAAIGGAHNRQWTLRDGCHRVDDLFHTSEPTLQHTPPPPPRPSLPTDMRLVSLMKHGAYSSTLVSLALCNTTQYNTDNTINPTQSSDAGESKAGGRRIGLTLLPHLPSSSLQSHVLPVRVVR